MKRYAVIVRGLEAATDQEAADAVRELRANLQLPYSGVVTVEEWLYDVVTAEPPTATGGRARARVNGRPTFVP